MSYDLDFWKYKTPLPSKNHQAVYERLSNGEFVEGLEDIPVDAIVARVGAVFSSLGWATRDHSNWESDRGAFQLFTTPQFLRVDCYGMGGDDMNHFMDIAAEFGLPLYDPQVGTRFDGE